MAVYPFALIFSLLCLYLNWGMFMFFLLSKSDALDITMTQFLLSPAALWQSIKILGEIGWFSIGDNGSTVSGIFLWLIWLIESVGLIGVAIFGAKSILHEHVFCEQCNVWLESLNYNKRILFLQQESLTQALDGHIDIIFDQPLSPPNIEPQYRLNINQCSSCKIMATLDFDKITYQSSKDGVQEISKDISRVFVITPEQFERFQTHQFTQIELE